jgi:hypothetical protein
MARKRRKNGNNKDYFGLVAKIIELVAMVVKLILMFHG